MAKKITKVRNMLLDKVSVIEKYEGIKVEKKVKKSKVKEISLEQVEKLLTEQSTIAQERFSDTIPQRDSQTHESSPQVALTGKQRNRRAGR